MLQSLHFPSFLPPSLAPSLYLQNHLPSSPQPASHCSANKSRLETPDARIAMQSEDKKNPPTVSWGIASGIMNGHVCPSEWAGGAAAWMGICEMSVLPTARCEWRMTILIRKALQMIDLERWKKNTYLQTRAQTHTFNIKLGFFCSFTSYPHHIPSMGPHCIAGNLKCTLMS